MDEYAGEHNNIIGVNYRNNEANMCVSIFVNAINGYTKRI